MIDCADKNRRDVVLMVAKHAAVASLQDSLEEALKLSDSAQVENLSKLLDHALSFDPNQTRTFDSAPQTRTVQTDAVLCPTGDFSSRDCRKCTAKCDGYGHAGDIVSRTYDPYANNQSIQKHGNYIGMAPMCKPEDCAACFWNFVCEMETSHALDVEYQRVMDGAYEWERKQKEEKEERANITADLKAKCPFLTDRDFSHQYTHQLLALREVWRKEGLEGVKGYLRHIGVRDSNGEPYNLDAAFREAFGTAEAQLNGAWKDPNKQQEQKPKVAH